MQLILDELKKGNVRIVEFFSAADQKWQELLSDIDTISTEKLADRLHVQQGAFERICEERHLGKIVMAWSGFTHLYSCDHGFEDNGPRAYKLLVALKASFCSVEVKHAAKEAAKTYGVEDYA